MLEEWKRHPKAQAALLSWIDTIEGQSSKICEFGEALIAQTSTQWLHWLDHLGLASQQFDSRYWEDLGYVACESFSDPWVSGSVWRHKGAQLPAVVCYDSLKRAGLYLRVDHLENVCIANGVHAPNYEGHVHSAYRRVQIAFDSSWGLWAVERNGTNQLSVRDCDEDGEASCIEHKWLSRFRHDSDAERVWQEAADIVHYGNARLGPNRLAALIMKAERWYWQLKNRAGYIQKMRQDSLGLGWGNHDHHTFRCSRKHFCKTVQFFETIGFHTRERFYAGDEASWGAQVLENPISGHVLFLDVDLSAQELDIDYSNTQLPPLKSYKTIGLWCALHGDSFFQAGMHHLEAQFCFDLLTEDLRHYGVNMMEPFSKFDYLKQAFTEGQRWKVEPCRIESLLNEGIIDEAFAEKIRLQGALGSHLENLQRHDGYKGFNQKNVSYIIAKTNPSTNV